MPNTELTEDLMAEMEQIIRQYLRLPSQKVSPAMLEELRCAVLRDFSLAGVRARGLTPAEFSRQGKLGGRPRAGETAEEARARRRAELGLIDNGINDYDCDETEVSA